MKENTSTTVYHVNVSENKLVLDHTQVLRDIGVDVLSAHFRIMDSFVFRLQVGTVTNIEGADVQRTITSVNIYQLTPATNCCELALLRSLA